MTRKYRYKYNVGDYIGPDGDILILERNVGGNAKRIRLKCPICGNENWIVDLSNIHKGVKRCYECYKKERIEQFQQHFKYKAGDLVGPFNIEFLRYTQTGYRVHSKGLFKCPVDGEPFEARVEHVASGKIKTCSEHGKVSSGEAIIKKILDNNNIKYTQQHIFKDCVNPETNYPLRFDFFLNELNTCLEYNGEQHYVPIDFFGGEKGFISLKKRDKIKLNYCWQHGINLVYFKYDETEKEIEAKIHSILLERA